MYVFIQLKKIILKNISENISIYLYKYTVRMYFLSIPHSLICTSVLHS
uniref:Uncharacterized protein n=1 Tax=Anguilla anguilla TaxID=7936 RepID=A0A0E9PFH0_ANGAN